MTLLAFGLNHATAPLAVREKVTFRSEILPDALGELRARAGADEAAILSTCNRTEIYCSLEAGQGQRPIEWLSAFHGIRNDELQPYLYCYPDAGAVKHVLRVASGLDSMVLGEPQVLGQLKGAYLTAIDAGSIGQYLDRLFQHSFRVAKQIRSNTAIGSHPVSVAFAAVRLAQQIFGDLARRTALLIGAGDTIELTAKHLSESGLRRMIIANRTLERSQRLANEFSAYAISLDDLPLHLDEADIIISSTASPGRVLDRPAIERAVARRRHHPVFIVDVAVPRDIDPAAGDLEDVYLYTIDDLRQVIEENIGSRREAAKQAEEIIDTQVIHFMEWMNSRDAVTVIRAMRDRARAMQDEVLARARHRLQQGEDAEQVVQEVARVLVNRLIHSPSARLRRNAGDEELIKAARSLFDLPREPDSPDKSQ